MSVLFWVDGIAEDIYKKGSFVKLLKCPHGVVYFT